jgi:uncharacterized cupin superfamily protein
MPKPTAHSIIFDGAAQATPLTVRGPRVPSLAGAPVESVHELHSDSHARTGIWECTPGSFDSARNGDTEVMHFVAGDATITSADGETYEIRPGSVLVAPDGWRGAWEIRETVRKVYTIWNTTTADGS